MPDGTRWSSGWVRFHIRLFWSGRATDTVGRLGVERGS